VQAPYTYLHTYIHTPTPALMFRDNDIQRVVNLLRISPLFQPSSGTYSTKNGRRRPKHVAVCTVMTRGVGSVRNWINLTLKFAKAQAVSRRPVTAEVRVRSQVSLCEICGERSGSGTGVSPSISICLVSIIPAMLHIHSSFTDCG